MFEFLTSLSLWGTIVNALGIIAGAVIGLIIRRLSTGAKENSRVNDISEALMKGVALCVFLIGVSGAIKTGNIMIVIVSITIGAVIGTLLCLEDGIKKLGELIEKKTKGKFGKITEGFVSASLLFCVGSMAIVGSLNSGLMGDHSMLYAKSLLDAIAAAIFSTTLGFGVMFSSVLVFLYQGIICLAAEWVAPMLSSAAINGNLI